MVFQNKLQKTRNRVQTCSDHYTSNLLVWYTVFAGLCTDVIIAVAVL